MSDRVIIRNVERIVLIGSGDEPAVRVVESRPIKIRMTGPPGPKGESNADFPTSIRAGFF